MIYANQIIEHLVYPKQLITVLKQYLKPQGRLVVTTPNFDYIKNNLPSFNQLGDPKQWEHLQFSADGDGHFYAYSHTELKHIFDSVSFEKIEIIPFESPFISGHIKVRHLHGTLPLSLLKTLDYLAIHIPYLKHKLSFQLMVIAKNF